MPTKAVIFDLDDRDAFHNPFDYASVEARLHRATRHFTEQRVTGDLANQEELEAELAGRTSHTVVLNGHLPVRDTQHEGSVLQLSMAAMIEAPFERGES